MTLAFPVGNINVNFNVAFGNLHPTICALFNDTELV